MELTPKIEFIDNPEFNLWLNESFPILIDDYEFSSSEVLYNLKYDLYQQSLERYNKDPQLVLSRITKNFPTPIAYYIDQAENNYQNDHHRLDLLKSCWEAIISFVFGLVVAEARHRNILFKELGLIKYEIFRSDKVHDKLTIVENILDYVNKNSFHFECAKIIPISTLTDIRRLNQERNGFEHASAKTAKQQQKLYSELYPIVSNILKQLIGFEKIKLFRYHDADFPLFPRCEIFNGSSLDGKKDIIALNKENYIEIMDEFNNTSVYAQVNDVAFSVSPFIHFYQEEHETNAFICFFKKKMGGGKYKFEVVSKSQEKEFEITDFEKVETKLKSLIE
ncbi:hypothetical protein ASU31_16635 [Pedobacter ginsenosidimutans]|uniref:Uncharacterized protein n=1 Tax=Pedobacter ginsenosidimutans TaxID=687842 RepID=A0A0T5VM70_9SPHI|nr:hypothetical protein [Pedobacter ginsenosidimutans]KRT14944.1 hypothetical protein ASU31_16635 [Pedobacter ginsenosidimutans]